MDKKESEDLQSYPLIQKLDDKGQLTDAINQSFASDEEEPLEPCDDIVSQHSNPPVGQLPPPMAYPSIRAENLQAIGVPQTKLEPVDTDKFKKYQKSVKCWSQLMIVVGYLFVFTGVINIIGNVIFIGLMDAFTNIGWTENGVYKSVRIDPGYMFLLALFKIIAGGVFIVK